MSQYDSEAKKVPEQDLEAGSALPDAADADAAAVPDAKEKRPGLLRSPAKVLVYHESWDNIDLEKAAENEKSAVKPAASPVAWWKGTAVCCKALQQKLAVMKEAAPGVLKRRRTIIIIVAVMLAMLLALALGVGLGTKGVHSTAGRGRPSHKPRAAVGPVGPLPTVTAADADDAAQLQSLLQIKSFLDPEGVLNDVWTEAAGKDRGYCKWKYVTCDAGGEVVTKVNLTTDSYVMILTGSLPPAAAFAGLPGLREIDVRMNALKGGLPQDWDELSGQLEAIRLDQNFINGTLPESWSKLVHLTELTLWDNELSGTLPESYADLVNLEVLDLSYNNLEGSLPEAWSSIGSQGKGLKELYLDVNQLTGPLPESYQALTHLEKLLLSENQLTGRLPEVGPSWSKVKEIWAEYNAFEGPLPESWGKMTQLQKLALNDNAFKGTVPASWANMKSLADLYLYNNPGLTGCVPSSIKASLELSPGFAVEDFVMDQTGLEGFC